MVSVNRNNDVREQEGRDCRYAIPGAGSQAIFERAAYRCHGDYGGEEIGVGGITRNPEHWDVDVSSTR